jgi:hypothetical protein
MTTALYRDTARRQAAQTEAEGAAEIPGDCYCRTPECRCPDADDAVDIYDIDARRPICPACGDAETCTECTGFEPTPTQLARRAA